MGCGGRGKRQDAASTFWGSGILYGIDEILFLRWVKNFFRLLGINGMGGGSLYSLVKFCCECGSVCFSKSLPEQRNPNIILKMLYRKNKHSSRSVTSAIRMLACGVSVTALSLTVQAREYEVEIVQTGLSSPMGIAAQWKSSLYFTEVPTPGVPGTEGGTNAVKRLNLRNGSITSVSEGEPYPKNVALDRHGSVYWTCQTAGVILKYDRRNGKQFVLPAAGLDAAPEEFLMSPSGISVDRYGDVLFTEVPMPGEFNANLVSVTDLSLIHI